MRQYSELQNLSWPEREKMISCTQDELSSIWKKLTDGTGCDEHGRLDVGEGVDAYRARDTDVEQTVTLSAVAPYGDFNSDGADVLYTRIRLGKDASWGMWERKS
jgi:hypothetical protein